MEIEDLAGKLITNIEWTSDEVTFYTDSGKFTFKAYGECCSNTWIESFDNYQDLIGKVLLRVESLFIEKIENDAYDLVKIYGYNFYTDTYCVLLDFRNSSNGYYGGCLDFVN